MQASAVAWVLLIALATALSVDSTAHSRQQLQRVGYRPALPHVTFQETYVRGDADVVILPLTPAQASQRTPVKPAVQESVSYYNFIPRFAGTLSTTGAPAYFGGQCFNTCSAYLKADSNGGSVVFSCSGKNSKLCSDKYLLADEEGFYLVDITKEGITAVSFPTWKASEYSDLTANGFQLFLVFDGVTDTLNNLYATWNQLFGCGPNMVADNRKFLQEKMNFTYQTRPQNVVTLNTSDIVSGMYLGIARLDGLDPMIMWGTGSHTGHTAITMWDNGQLYVMESTASPVPLTCDYWPPPENVMKTPWNLWIERAINASYLVTLWPLAPELQAKFNVTAALAFFNSVQGTPYGFSNFLTGWVDTVDGNYPSPLSAQLVATAFALVDRLAPTKADLFYLDSMNFRLQQLGLQTCADMECLLGEIETINMSFAELMTIPENDSWVYPDGKNMVCDVFVLSMYRAGGIFGNITFQATEQTPKDAYMMQLYDSNWQRPKPCAVDNLPYCQILGEFLMELPNWNTIPIYNNMNQRCNSQAPLYQRCPGFDAGDTRCKC